LGALNARDGVRGFTAIQKIRKENDVTVTIFDPKSALIVIDLLDKSA
jgi:hypothetical protein